MEPKTAKDERQPPEGGNPKIIYLTPEAKPREMGRCPSCGEEVAIDAKICDHCKRVLAVPTDPVDRASSGQTDAVDSLNYVRNALAAKYEVLEEVAKTESSIVFRAIQVQSEREVALKVLLQNVAKDHDYTDRFHRRARAIARLSHSNIISIYDEGIEGDVHYMAMEFLKGTDLQRKITEHGSLSPEELVNIMMPVMNALGYLHRNGIVHGNIKCSGIFLHEDGRIILFGFGIQQSTKGNRPSFSRDMESVEYLSPEEASGKGMDGRSDIYSLGVVMYYSLTGKLPYSETNPFATINLIINSRYIPINRLRQVPQWLENIVDKCLQKDISKRVQSCGEILGLLNAKSMVQSANYRQVEQPAREFPSVEQTRAKMVDTEPTGVKTTMPPIVEQPTPKETSNEHQKVESPVIEESLKKTTTIAQSIVKPQVVTEQPMKSNTKPEPSLSSKEEPPIKSNDTKPEPRLSSKEELPMKGSDMKPGPSSSSKEEKIIGPHATEPEIINKELNKGKKRPLVWVVAIGTVAILGVGITLMLMNKIGNFHESAMPNAETKYVEPTKEQSQNSQPVVNQENNGNEVRPSNENARPDELNAQKTQEASSTDDNKSTPSQVPSKSKASSDKEAPEAQVQPIIPLVSVPDLIGTQLNVAKTILSLNGLNIGAVSTIPDPANDGMVVRQVPKPGTRLQKGSTINLIVGSK